MRTFFIKTYIGYGSIQYLQYIFVLFYILLFALVALFTCKRACCLMYVGKNKTTSENTEEGDGIWLFNIFWDKTIALHQSTFSSHRKRWITANEVAFWSNCFPSGKHLDAHTHTDEHKEINLRCFLTNCVCLIVVSLYISFWCNTWDCVDYLAV